jgi:23S rRNA (cytosine1962-C5)-methyltransferase
MIFFKMELSLSIASGHPWIYSDAVRDPAGEPGEIVEIHGSRGFLALAWLDPLSPIVARVISLDPKERLDNLVARRIAAAMRLRAAVIDRETTTAFRALNGEGDHFPGLVVDVYGKVAVVRFDGAGARAFAHDRLVPVLRKELELETIYERSSRKDGGGGLMFGREPARELDVKEHGMTLLVDVVRGQKTGAFLDQRENRKLVRSIARGRRVLNLFSYTGGFTLAAALGGAQKTVSVDTAKAALETAKRTLERNGVTGDHEMREADAFEAIASVKKDEFDLIVVDPPNMAPSKNTVERALASYRALNVAALAAVESGGFVASASCSSHVDEPAFLSMLADAVAESGRPARIVTVRGAGPDHPYLPGHPEGRYLKFVLLAVG